MTLGLHSVALISKEVPLSLIYRKRNVLECIPSFQRDTVICKGGRSSNRATCYGHRNSKKFHQTTPAISSRLSPNRGSWRRRSPSRASSDGEFLKQLKDFIKEARLPVNRVPSAREFERFARKDLAEGVKLRGVESVQEQLQKHILKVQKTIDEKDEADVVTLSSKTSNGDSSTKAEGEEEKVEEAEVEVADVKESEPPPPTPPPPAAAASSSTSSSSSSPWSLSEEAILAQKAALLKARLKRRGASPPPPVASPQAKPISTESSNSEASPPPPPLLPSEIPSVAEEEPPLAADLEHSVVFDTSQPFDPSFRIDGHEGGSPQAPRSPEPSKQQQQSPRRVLNPLSYPGGFPPPRRERKKEASGKVFTPPPVPLPEASGKSWKAQGRPQNGALTGAPTGPPPETETEPLTETGGVTGAPQQGRGRGRGASRGPPAGFGQSGGLRNGAVAAPPPPEPVSSASGAEAEATIRRLRAENDELFNDILRKQNEIEAMSQREKELQEEFKSETHAELQKIKASLESREKELSGMIQELEEAKAQFNMSRVRTLAELSTTQQMLAEKDQRLKAAEEALSLLKQVRVEYWGEGSKVELAGSFNGWKDFVQMQPDLSSAIEKPDGSRGAMMWEVDIYLYPGTFEVKFIVDGNWTVDTRRDIKMNDFGQNNVIYVESSDSE